MKYTSNYSNKLAVSIILIIFISCNMPKKEQISVNFSDTLAHQQFTKNGKINEVYVAIASMTSPKETIVYYHDLINFISKKAGYPILIKQKKTYEEVNRLIENSEVDFAFICSGAYAKEYRQNKVKLLVAPVIENKISYQAYIIANKNSSINKFSDLRNKTFAFTDPISNTGKMYPLSKLKNINEKESSFFAKTLYTYGHDISIQMVNRGIVDGASVHSLIFKYLSLHEPEKVVNIKIIDQSKPFGMPPVVVPEKLDTERYNTYLHIFLNMDKDSVGKKILTNLNIDKFVVVNDSIYKSVLNLEKYIKNEGN